MRSSPFIGVAAVALSFGAHWVLLSWVERSLPALAARRRPLLVACGAIALTPAIARFFVMHARSAVADFVFALSLVELMIVLTATLPLLALIGISEIVQGRQRERERERESDKKSASAAGAISRRGAIEAVGGTAVLGATTLAFGWGMTLGRHGYQVREVPVRIPGLPKELDGYVIAQISDVHAGLFVGEREFAEGAELIRGIRPDLVVATGDLTDYDPRHVRPLVRALADIAPRDGVFAILGNHDYYSGHEAVSDAIRAGGITLLVNDARIIRATDGTGFALAGLDDLWSRRYGGPGPQLTRTLASIPKETPRILLAHQPDAFERAAGRVALQLSGHTHGGQIRPGNLVLGSFVAGRYDRDGSVLYVNRGFGVAGPPARIGVPPEITKIVLVAA